MDIIDLIKKNGKCIYYGAWGTMVFVEFENGEPVPWQLHSDVIDLINSGRLKETKRTKQSHNNYPVSNPYVTEYILK